MGATTKCSDRPAQSPSLFTLILSVCPFPTDSLTLLYSRVLVMLTCLLYGRHVKAMAGGKEVECASKIQTNARKKSETLRVCVCVSVDQISTSIVSKKKERSHVDSVR